MEIRQAEFLTSIVSMKDYKPNEYPEIAIVGKSNVGKSSLINYLTNNYKLARTSGQPGKTRLINFFIINHEFLLVDLPGYGYARVSKSEKAKWGEMIESYLTQSTQLRHLFHLVDIRHDPTEDDILMSMWIRHFQIPYTIIATKADKIVKSKRGQRTKNIQSKLELPREVKIIPFSSIGRIGRDHLLEEMDSILVQKEEILSE